MKSKVKRYECLWSNQTRKHKTYQDGYLRHHHYNSRLYLMNDSMAEFMQTFYTPPSGESVPLKDSFRLEEGAELAIEDQGYWLQIGALVWEGETDITEMNKSRQEAKKSSAADAALFREAEDDSEWAIDSEWQVPINRPKKGSQPRAVNPIQPMRVPPKPSASSSNAPQSYRGLGIAPPKSYLSNSTGATPKSNRNFRAPGNSAKSVGAHRTPQRAESEYSTPQKPYNRPTPPSQTKMIAASASPVHLGTRSPATSRAFRMPRPGTQKAKQEANLPPASSLVRVVTAEEDDQSGDGYWG